MHSTQPLKSVMWIEILISIDITYL